MTKEKVQVRKKNGNKTTNDKMKIIKNLIEKVKERYAFYGEIMDALEDIEDLDLEQIDKIYESLEEMGIEVTDDPGEDSEEEALEDEDEKMIFRFLKVYQLMILGCI